MMIAEVKKENKISETEVRINKVIYVLFNENHHSGGNRHDRYVTEGIHYSNCVGMIDMVCHEQWHTS